MDRAEFTVLLQRKKGNRTQREFSEELGISPAFLNDLLQGKRDPGAGLLSKFNLVSVTRYEPAPRKRPGRK